MNQVLWQHVAWNCVDVQTWHDPHRCNTDEDNQDGTGHCKTEQQFAEVTPSGRKAIVIEPHADRAHWPERGSPESKRSVTSINVSALPARAKTKCITPPIHWRRYADPRLTLCLGLVCIVAAGFLFHFPPARFVGGPSLSFAGAVVGYPLFSLGSACLLSASLSWERFFPTWRVPGVATIAIISYSLYLSHKMTSHATQLLLGPESLTGIQGFVIYYASSIVVGALLWRLIEHPFLQLRDRLLNGVRG